MTTLEKWTHPEYYEGATFHHWYLLPFVRTRDSDCLTESNFCAAVQALGGESEHVLVSCSRHWACGWLEEILIRQDAPAELLDKARQLIERYENYPVLDEDDYSAREAEENYERALDVWSSMTVKERIAKLRDIGHWAGSWSELRESITDGTFIICDASGLI